MRLCENLRIRHGQHPSGATKPHRRIVDHLPTGGIDHHCPPGPQPSALAEDLRLVIFLDAEALARIAPPKALFQDR